MTTPSAADLIAVFLGAAMSVPKCDLPRFETRSHIAADGRNKELMFERDIARTGKYFTGSTGTARITGESTLFHFNTHLFVLG
jgi:hypothetical protein